MIEIVVIETVEAVLLAIVKLVVGLLILHSDTWVPTIVALMIYKEQSILERYTIGLDLLTAQS